MPAPGATVGPAMGEDRMGDVRRDAVFALGLGVSAAVFYLAPWPVVYGLAFLSLAVLTFLRLDFGLLVVPLFVPFFMAPKHFGSHEFAPSELFVILDCAIALLYAIGAKRSGLAWHRLRTSPFLLPAAVLLLGATVSTALAVDRHHALEWYRWVILEPMAFFALLLLLANRRSWPWIFGGLLAAGLTTGLIGIWQYATHTDLTRVPGTSIDRIRALYGSPDNLGLLYDRVIPLWFAIVLSSWLARWRRAIWFLCGAVMLVALVLTNSRGAWLAVALGCLLVLVVRYSWGRYLLLAFVLLLGGFAAVKGPKVIHIFRSNQTNTVQSRVYIWGSAIHMIRDHPVFGVGPDNFLHYYAPTHRQDLYNTICLPGLGYMNAAAGAEPCLSHPHNEILDFWLSTGIIGLAGFLWLEVVFWRDAIREWKERVGDAPRWVRPFLLGSMAAMAAALIHGAVDNSYFLIDLATIFWLLCGYVSWIGSDTFAEVQERLNGDRFGNVLRQVLPSRVNV